MIKSGVSNAHNRQWMGPTRWISPPPHIILQPESEKAMTSKKRQALAKLINRIALFGHAERSREAEEIMAVLEDTVEADGFAVLRVHSSEKSVEVLGSIGLKTPRKYSTERFDAPDITRAVLDFPEKTAIFISGPFNNDPFLSKEDTDSLLISRERTGDQFLATIAIRREESAFTTREVERFGAVASMVNLLGKNAYLERTVSQEGHDPVTDLPLYAIFYSALNREIARARRGNGAITVGILSVESPENMTETSRDDLILYITHVVQDQLRSFDIIARYGARGISFMLPDLAGDEGVKVSKRILKGLDEQFGSSDIPLEFSCFIGLSAYPVDTSTADRLIEMAEAAMMEASDSGAAGVLLWSDCVSVA